ncbi:MAG TPA: MBL fold metallo-hydrolase [Chthonomonadaceae bacterium]|nr:MBL fold metallo-hydrolase [Chthonomonadaceae bacterium]
MQLTWNGTGSAWSRLFGNASAVLEADGQRLLIDCGHTVPGRLQQMGLSLRDMDAVFISHLHGDHIYGLEEWGFRSYLQWKIKPRLLIAENLLHPIWRNVFSGTMAQVCDQSCHLRDYFTVLPLQIDQPLTLGPWTLAAHPVRHVPHAPCYGLKVRAEGVSLGFTCDSLADADPWFYEDTELVFHDCSFAPYFPETIHAHFEQLLTYPEAFRAKTYLVHYDDDLAEKRQDPTWQATLAASRMRLTEPFVPFVF